MREDSCDTPNSRGDNTRRYAYIKYGPVISEVKTYGTGKGMRKSGPDAFVHEFLEVVGKESTIILSMHSEDARYELGALSARELGQQGWKGGKLIRDLYSMVWTGYNLIRFQATHILCSSTGGSMWASCCVAKLRGARFVHSLHNRINTGNTKWRGRIIGVIDRFCIKKADAVICHGPYLKQQLIDSGVGRGRIVEFEVALQELLEDLQKNSNGQARNPSTKGNTILYVGRMEEDKGIFDLLDACGPLLSRDSEIDLVYLGEGGALGRLRERIREYGLGGQVRALGAGPHSDVGRWLQSATVLVVPTKKAFPEGRCMAALEALVVGIPVIAPRFGPFPYFVKHRVNGLLYEADSLEDLRISMESVLGDRGLLEQLRHGASQTGKSLVNHGVSYSEAIRVTLMSGKTNADNGSPAR